MKSNILINCLVLFYDVGIFPSDLLTFFILIDLHANFEVFAMEPLNAALIFLDWDYNLFVKPIDAPNFSERNSHQVYTSTEYWLYENFSIISPKVRSSCSPETMSLRVSFPASSSFSPTMTT